MINEYWSTYNIERCARPNGSLSTYKLELSERLDRY